MDVPPPVIDGSCKIFGMENFGNTCYCNSVLQCLYYSKPFREHVLRFNEKKYPSARRRRRTHVEGTKPHPFTLELERANSGLGPDGALQSPMINGGTPANLSANASIGGSIGTSATPNAGIDPTHSGTMGSTGSPVIQGPYGSQQPQAHNLLSPTPPPVKEKSKLGRRMSLFKRDNAAAAAAAMSPDTSASFPSPSNDLSASSPNFNLQNEPNARNTKLTLNTNVAQNPGPVSPANNNSTAASSNGNLPGGPGSGLATAPKLSQEALKCQHDPTRPGLKGLPVGACYMGQNVPLVGFNDDVFATPETRKRAALFKGPIVNLDLSMADEYGMKESLFTALKDVFECIAENASRTGVVSPQRLIDLVKKKNELFRSTAHQDAHEFFNFLLNEVIEEVDVSGLGISTNVMSPQDALQSSASSATFASSQSVSWIHDLFEGLLSNETKCLTCETVSRRDEQFLDLSIDLERNTSITSCLKQFSASEMMCERNKFHCDTCGGLQEAEKRMKLKRLPKILALHLKRFKFTEDMQRNVKLFHRVMYPKTLRLVNTTFDAEDPEKLYELCSVVVHIGGGPYHGHYVSVVKTEHMGWLMFDDEMVEAVDENYVFNFFGNNKGMATAYVLFYQEVVPESLSSSTFDAEYQLKASDRSETTPEPVNISTDGHAWSTDSTAANPSIVEEPEPYVRSDQSRHDNRKESVNPFSDSEASPIEGSYVRGASFSGSDNMPQSSWKKSISGSVPNHSMLNSPGPSHSSLFRNKTNESGQNLQKTKTSSSSGSSKATEFNRRSSISHKFGLKKKSDRRFFSFSKSSK